MESDESNEQENGDDSDYDGKDDNYDDNGNNDDDDDDGDDDNDDNCHKKFSTNCTYSMNKADGPKLYPFERLLSFVSLHKLCDNIEDLRWVKLIMKIIIQQESHFPWCHQINKSTLNPLAQSPPDA